MIRSLLKNITTRNNTLPIFFTILIGIAGTSIGLLINSYAELYKKDFNHINDKISLINENIKKIDEQILSNKKDISDIHAKNKEYLSNVVSELKRVIKVKYNKCKLYDINTFKFVKIMNQGEMRNVLGEVYLYEDNLKGRYFIIKTETKLKRLISANDVTETKYEDHYEDIDQ